MSSRYGGVVNGDDLLDFLKKEALKIISQSDSELRGKMTPLQKEKLAEAVALSACKYGFLKFSKNRNFAFDFQASLSVEGDSGPYLQYTYTRCFSVLKKAKVKGNDFSLKCHKLEKEELALLRAFYQLPEVLIEALNSFDPHFVCQYLLKLAQKYNLFYQKHRIINSKGQERELRLFLTKVTAQILKMGLEILGITVLEKM